MSKVLITGSAGFIGGYVVEELLARGHEVVGLDNYSKYGPVTRSYDDHPDYRFVEGDATRCRRCSPSSPPTCDHFIAGAAMIGGISYFHAYAYDLLATNERIMAASCDAAIAAHRAGRLQEGHLHVLVDGLRVHRALALQGRRRARVPPPMSSYGFQKLAVEYYARAAWDQYRLPYTIVRPFNCVGVGEGRAIGEAEVLSGNVKLAMSHVVPDLVQKIVKGQDPLRILGDGTRCATTPTAATSPAASSTAMEHPAALNEDFNLSTAESTTVLELAELIWRKIKGTDVPFRYDSDEPFAYDVQKRVPDVDQGPRGARLRGHHHPRRHARRGHPVGDLGGPPGTAVIREHVSVATRQDEPLSLASRVGRLRAGLAGLFASAEKTRPITPRAVVAAIAAVVAATAVCLLRIRGANGASPLNVLWAEDGSNFLTDAYLYPPLHNLVSPINGYHLLYGRILAEVASVFPVAWGAGVLITLSAASSAVMGLIVFVASGRVLPHPLARVVAGLCIIVTPLAYGMANQVAPLHFVMVYAAFWCLMWTPQSRTGRLVQFALLLLTALSTILAVFLLPLAALRVWACWDRYSAMLSGASDTRTRAASSVIADRYGEQGRYLRAETRPDLGGQGVRDLGLAFRLRRRQHASVSDRRLHPATTREAAPANPTGWRCSPLGRSSVRSCWSRLAGSPAPTGCSRRSPLGRRLSSSLARSWSTDTW